jgi:hypothetical protein
MGRPQIHVDPVIMVIYYCILYNGLAFGSDTSLSPDNSKVLHCAYIGCIRSCQVWQREASGTLSDFVAALSMVS